MRRGLLETPCVRVPLQLIVLCIWGMVATVGVAVALVQIGREEIQRLLRSMSERASLGAPNVQRAR